MNKHNIKILLFLLSTVLISCASNNQLNNSPEIIFQDRDFTIEGKFKIKINDFKQNGYFVFKGQRNQVTLTLGKNYLLPERKFLFNREDLVSFSELFKDDQFKLSSDPIPQDLKVEKLISIILGENKINSFGSWSVSYVKREGVKQEMKIPSKIIFYENLNSIEIILKKVLI